MEPQANLKKLNPDARKRGIKTSSLIYQGIISSAISH